MTEIETLEQRIGQLEKDIRDLKRQNQATIHQLSQVSELIHKHEMRRLQKLDDFK